MKLDSMSFFQLASKRMHWLSAGQQVIAENIANADTPGFKAREVSPFSELVNGTTTRGMSTTHAAHISGGGYAGGVRVSRDDGTWETSISGNSVVLEQQTLKSSELSGAHQMAALLYGKGQKLLSLAVAGQR